MSEADWRIGGPITPADALVPPLRLCLRFLLNYVVAEYESDFSHGPGLVLVRARGTEDVTRRNVAGMNPGKIPAKEEAPVLKSGRYGD